MSDFLPHRNFISLFISWCRFRWNLDIILDNMIYINYNKFRVWTSLANRTRAARRSRRLNECDEHSACVSPRFPCSLVSLTNDWACKSRRDLIVVIIWRSITSPNHQWRSGRFVTKYFQKIYKLQSNGPKTPTKNPPSSPNDGELDIKLFFY